MTILPEILLEAYITIFLRYFLDKKNEMMNQISNALLTMDRNIMFSVLLWDYSAHRQVCQLEVRNAGIRTNYVDTVLVIVLVGQRST